MNTHTKRWTPHHSAAMDAACYELIYAGFKHWKIGQILDLANPRARAKRHAKRCDLIWPIPPIIDQEDRMNLDQIRPCDQCGNDLLRTLFVRAGKEWIEADPGELLYQESEDLSWRIQCGSCGLLSVGQNDLTAPTFRNQAPGLAAEIERLRVELAYARRGVPYPRVKKCD